MDSYTSTFWTDPFPVEGVSGNFSLLPCLIEIHVFNANFEDHDLRFAASDIDLHYLPSPSYFLLDLIIIFLHIPRRNSASEASRLLP